MFLFRHMNQSFSVVSHNWTLLMKLVELSVCHWWFELICTWPIDFKLYFKLGGFIHHFEQIKTSIRLHFTASDGAKTSYWKCLLTLRPNHRGSINTLCYSFQVLMIDISSDKDVLIFIEREFSPFFPLGTSYCCYHRTDIYACRI